MWILLWSVLLLVPSVAGAHPGRLDQDGCHTVRTAYTYKDGRKATVGEVHCHRLLGVAGGVTLDGLETLQDGRHDHDEPPIECDEHTACGSESSVRP